MRYVINNSVKIPAYIQLYEQVRDDIIKEVYRYNTKLPSKRLVAEELGVSTVTVEHAYALLSDEGYIEPRERSGYFVIFRIADYFTSSVDMHKASYKYEHQSESSYTFPFSVFSKAVRKVISDYGNEILNKSENRGCLELRQGISDYLFRSRGIKASVEQIIIGSGAEYLYGLIVELLGRELVFALEKPSYEKIEQVYRASGVRCELLPLCNDGIDSSALVKTKAQVLHISPYRSFPSGITASASKRHEYIRWSSTLNRYIIEDDFESEFSVSKKPEETLFATSDYGNVIYMNTFSKTISPALRVGYMVIPETLAKRFEERLGFYSCTVSTFEQLVLCELITGGDFERHVNRIRRKKRKEMNGG